VSLTYMLYVSRLVIDLVLPDEPLLCGASTFLDFEYSLSNDTHGPKSSKTKMIPIDNKYYPSAHYVPHDFSGTTLWTPLPCFPPNTLPYVITSVCHADQSS
jgi:hypothetical protein